MKRRGLIYILLFCFHEMQISGKRKPNVQSCYGPVIYFLRGMLCHGKRELNV